MFALLYAHRKDDDSECLKLTTEGNELSGI